MSVEPTDGRLVMLCYCSCPDTASAQAIASAMVGEGLAACVQRLPAVVSTYRWQDQLMTDSEELLLIKTTLDRLPAMQQRLLQLHPYDLPELIAVPVEHGHPAYLEWVRSSSAA